MTVRGFTKALARACLYVFIYLAWQIITVNWASVIVSAKLALEGDVLTEAMLEGMTAAEYEAYMLEASLELSQKVLAVIEQYVVHLTLLSGILTLVTYAVIFRMRKKKLLAEAGFTRIGIGQGIILLALGAALNLFATTLIGILPFPEAWVDSYAENASVLTDAPLWISVLTTVIAAPLVEETVFRGLCLSRLKRGMPMLAAMLISAWCFGAMHGTMIWFLYASVLGFLLAWIYEKFRSLTACVIVHFSFNLCGMLSEQMGEVPENVYMMLLAAGGLASMALLLYIQKKSDYPIEFSFSSKEMDPNE